MRIISILLILVFSLPVLAQKKITLEDIQIYGTFRQKSIPGLRSMNDGLHYSSLEGGTKIVKYSFKDGKKVGDVFDLNDVENAPIKSFSKYTFSDDETKILLTTDIKKIYRHSYSAVYYVWNIVTEEFSELSSKGRQEQATFSPNGERVAFVRNNNIFIKSLKFGTESQLTFDGKFNEIINGKPDWVYEEEFSFNKAFSWSPDSKFLAYIRFDETKVNEFFMTMYQGERPSKDENELYPSPYKFKYPKAGEINSTVSVHIYELKSKTTIETDIGEETDIYVPRLKWTTDANELAIFRLNRRQNVVDVVLANPFTGDSRPFITEKNDRYVSEKFLDDFIFLPDNKYVVLSSERDGYTHLYLYDRQGFEVKQLTSGEFDVTDFYGFDAKRKLFYYQAAKETPMQREVYYTSLDGKKFGKLSTQTGTNRAVFSKAFNYYINYFNTLTTPNFVTLHDYKGKTIRTLEDNQQLKELINEYQLEEKSFFQFETSEGNSLNGWMIKPADFDENKTYPVLITQYSGPNSQSVTDKWSVDWYNYLAQEGYLVVCVDPRGTGARGEDFRKVTYLQLGKYESEDLVESAKYLQTLPFVDKQNMAIWGWSYGGFTTILSLEKGGEIFKAGIAVAPVTHYKYYDSVYTERYMRTPQDNPDGYDDNSAFANPEGIKGRLLIVHGSADDNVHAQNTMEFTEKLVQAGVQFDMAIYTNRNHSIYGGKTRLHLYQRMTDFLNNHLK